MVIYLGHDSREQLAYDVAAKSMQATTKHELDIRPISMQTLGSLYRRLTVWDKHSRLWDLASDAPMSTTHAIARFFIPILEPSGFALFADSDILVRRDIAEIFSLADPQYAVQVVKHNYNPPEGMKKGGEFQKPYARKNWSSVILWNLDHPAHQLLNLDVLNSAPGRDLHQFCWLDDPDIGALPDAWNWLVGHSTSPDPAIVHYTEGIPSVSNGDLPYDEEWYAYASEVRDVR